MRSWMISRTRVPTLHVRLHIMNLLRLLAALEHQQIRRASFVAGSIRLFVGICFAMVLLEAAAKILRSARVANQAVGR